MWKVHSPMSAVACATGSEFVDTCVPAVDEGIDVAHFQVLGRDAHFQADIKNFSLVTQAQRDLPFGGMACFDHWSGRPRRLFEGACMEAVHQWLAYCLD
jgi:hypothetical protein